ncbi:MAG: hypothetical protein PHP69_06420 [Candidatus Omnitrophica bacterium]|jgi:hypothetical protein|nr:hypothetical protein [Candidatus Omnitrophota bacterium]MDD5080713.1 hypothetical protein [Candidatus Omnitrophota bacterium]
MFKGREVLFFVLFVSLFIEQGCVPLLVAGTGAVLYEVTDDDSELDELRRRANELYEFQANREDVLDAVVSVFSDRGYVIKDSDYQMGMIAAADEKEDLYIVASVESVTQETTTIRMTMKVLDCVIGDKELLAKLADDIQTEILKKKESLSIAN